MLLASVILQMNLVNTARHHHMPKISLSSRLTHLY